MQVKIKAIYISPGHDFVGRFGKERLDHGYSTMDTVTCDAGMGIVGDRYYNHKEDFKGQITFISEEVVISLQKELGLREIEAHQLRRNVLVAGIDLNELIGVTFRIDGAVFYGMEECRPCKWMNQSVGEGALPALVGKGGLSCSDINDVVIR